MQAAISSKVLGRIKLEHISGTDLTNVASHIAVILKFHVDEQDASV
ncbi:hypothetical protein A2U01_0006557 [Trifolium medium]|uniref:Uncharacterized protein n=1 Tax=Trifolium medium TaxID=97028 RepID=A0A392MG29_9FABA|nr:hypothetical protein [Trifolium medium]